MTRGPAAGRLHAVGEAIAEVVRFCGYCGERPPAGHEPGGRVCPHCGLGLVLEADAALAPAAGGAYSVVDLGLTLRVLSRGAEELFGLRETDVVGHHLETLVVPAQETDDDRTGLRRLLAAAAHAPLGAGETGAIVVRPATAFGIRYRLRLGPCRPGPAALLSLSPV